MDETPRTFMTTEAVDVDVRSAATGVKQPTCDSFTETTRQRLSPIRISTSPMRLDSPSPSSVRRVPPATEPDSGDKARMMAGVVMLELASIGERPRAPLTSLVETVMA